MSPVLTLYRNAVLCAQQQDWDLATAALDAAYNAAPPAELSLEDCRTLKRHSDDLALVGQHLPCLTPTIQLFSRFLSISA
ncbi:hypothetical protein LAJ19_17455 (plasmid) [Deinococcus taeanensis]|uniref:hypothetical protein n=1 Tax=Deinococcus taeanensis TaxID=2737050 RepID=UPI001CDC9678|nr:hypothetical protein [Deinococcus taeanensis]UBV44562.1 hypothetical protein LAJ19_17455 [Deinococcus taeanensis]